MALVGTEKSSSESRKNRGRLRYRPIDTCPKTELTFDDIVEMYSQQPPEKKIPKKIQITFENVMREIIDNEPTCVSRANNDDQPTFVNRANNDVELRSNYSKNIIRGIGNKKSSSKATKNQKSLCHGPISTCTKKQLTFDEIIEMYTQHSLEEELAKDTEVTFENIMDEILGSKPTPVDTVDNNIDIAASRNYVKNATGSDSNYTPYTQSSGIVTSHIQDTLHAKLSNIETSQHKCFSDFSEIFRNEVTNQKQTSSTHLKSYDAKEKLCDNYQPKLRGNIIMKPDKQVHSLTLREPDIEIPCKSLSFKTLVRVLHDETERAKSVNMLRPCEIGKQEQPNKSDQPSFNHKNFISSTNNSFSSKVASSKDYKNNLESRHQHKEIRKPLEDSNYTGYLNKERDRDNLISRDLKTPFNDKYQQENSLLCRSEVRLPRSASKDFDSTRKNLSHQELKNKINLNFSKPSKNATEQFSFQDVQIEVPLQCKPFSYLVDALRKFEDTFANNNISSKNIVNRTHLPGHGFESCKTAKTDGNATSALEKANICLYSVPPVNHFSSRQTLPCPKSPTTDEHNKHIPEVEQITTTVSSKTSKLLNVNLSEERTFRNGIGISERTLLENAFLGKDSESQSYSLSQQKCDTTKQLKLDERSHDDISLKIFSKEALKSVIETLRINQLTTRDDDYENNLGAENRTNFRKKYIKRYRRGKTKIYQITVACRKRKALTEKCNNNLSFDEIVNIMSQEVENPAHEIEIVSLPRPASFETDASKSECLSTGSADHLETSEKQLRTGLNIISKDRSLLFSGSDYILQHQNKDKIIMKIQEILLQVWEDMAANKSPQLTVRKQSYENCVFRDSMLQLKPVGEAIMRVIHYKYSQSKLKFSVIMYLLNRIRILLETNTQLTKREIYYQLKEFIAKQGLIDSAINTISCLLNVGPWDLNILAQKGLVYGNLKIRFTSGNVLNCGIPGVLIPHNLDEIIEIESQSYFILVVEKEAIYHKLLQEDLPNRLTRPFILVTGKGFPDLNTQLFLKKLWIIMSIPVFIFVDGDFHGISIMLNYRYGSLKNAHLSQYLAIPNAKWIGVRPSEMVRLGITRQPLSDREKNLISNLMQSPYMAHNPLIKAELKILLDHGYKGGIEGLIKEQNYLSEMYLPYKLYTQDYI